MDAVGQLSAALVGRYTVDREIGRGGMATVYLARDVRHNRKVALKVLNPELGAVLGVERFLAEIQVTANLQHPNLLPLFDSGEANGLLFYVMPFIEGESLRAMLAREKQLAIEDAVHIAAAIAGALDYAHRHGVIHRDLKPENILIHDGQPLVADFGIALAVSNAGGGRITQTGLSLGTPQYMSPEQATGDREIDGRTDLYSLGALTYEMLAGEPPHDGKTSQAIIAKVLTDRPRSIRLSRESVPLHVESAVMRALAKLPADRFHTAHEFADALQGKSFATAALQAAPTAEQSPSRWRTALPWSVALTASVAGIVAATLAWRSGDRTAEARTLRYEISLPQNVDVTTGRVSTVAIAPKGRYVVYVATRPDGSSRLHVRADDDLEPRPIAGSEGATSVSFSPDGTELVFTSGGALRKVPVTGGKVETITDAFVGLKTPTWSPSGWIIASDNKRLVKVPAVGGAPEPMTRPDSAHGETAQFNPVALTDGKTVLYAAGGMGGATAARIGVATIDGKSTILKLAGSYPLGVVDGFLIYATAAGTLMAAPFDASGPSVGEPVSLADQALSATAFGTTFAHMASDGSLVYVAGAMRRQAVLVSPNGIVHELSEPGQYRSPRFSPDGQQIAMSVGNESQRDVWLMRLPSASLTRFTFGSEINDRPEWKPDGSAVLFRSTRGARHGIWIATLAGGQPTPLFGRSEAHIDEGVMSPDGRNLIVQRDTIGNGETWIAALDGTNKFLRVDSAPGVYGGRFSPDGKWVVFTASQTGAATEQVYVKPFPSLAKVAQVSLTGGGTPVWAPDGKKIYYVNGHQLIAAIIGSEQPFTIASRTVVLSSGYDFQGIHADYDVARDGTIVAFQLPSAGTQLVVVRNIGAELRARLRGHRGK
jgi:serine/threonine-protein kinase